MKIPFPALVVTTVTSVMLVLLLGSCTKPELDEERASHDALARYEEGIRAFGDDLPPLAEAWFTAREEALQDALQDPQDAMLPLEAELFFSAREPDASAWRLSTEPGRSYEARYESPVIGIMLDLYRVEEKRDGAPELVRIGESLDGRIQWLSPAGADYILRAQAEILTRGEAIVRITQSRSEE